MVFYFKKLVKKSKINLNKSMRKEKIIKTRAEINKIERRTSMKLKTGYF